MTNTLLAHLAALSGWQIAMLSISVLALIATYFTDKETAALRAKRQG